MKILILDIETRPNMAYVWGLWDQNVGLSQLVEAGAVICFAAKWHKQKKVYFYSDFHDGHETMIQKAWELMDEADAIVHFNGRSFDIKHLHREFLLAGMAPPSPHQDIDLLNTVKQKFKFPSNKLQHVSESLGVGSKVQHEGFELWLDCIAQSESAWATMKRYNIQDVRLTEQVYEILLPWLTTHPNRAVYEGRPDACPRCGGTSHQRRGSRRTNTYSYEQYQCNDCKSYFANRTKEAGPVTNK